MPARPEQLRDHRGARQLRRAPAATACAARCSAGSAGPSRRARCAGGSPRSLRRAVGFRRVDHLLQLVLELELLAERGGAALERERAHRHLPAVARRADDVARRRARAVEEHLGELRVAGDLHDRADLDARLLHRHEQVRESLVALRRGIGAAHDEAPVAPLRPRGPDLLAVQHPLARRRVPRASGRSRDPSRRSAPSSPDTRSLRPRRSAAGSGASARRCRRRSRWGRAGPRRCDRGGPDAPARAYSSK